MSVLATTYGARLGLRRVTAMTGATSMTRRTMLTKAERWTLQTFKNAEAQGLVPDANGKATMDLAALVPQIETRWKQLSLEEQYGLFRHLEELQKKDWKELTMDEKKAAYHASFGPHGPRKPVTEPGQGMKTFVGTASVVGLGVAAFYTMRHFAHPPPKTMTKEYQQQMNERALREKQNPITGISSEGYKGKGHEQTLLY